MLPTVLVVVANPLMQAALRAAFEQSPFKGTVPEKNDVESEYVLPGQSIINRSLATFRCLPFIELVQKVLGSV